MSFKTLPHKNVAISAIIAFSILVFAFSQAHEGGMTFTSEQAAVGATIPKIISDPTRAARLGNPLYGEPNSSGSAPSTEMSDAKKEFFAKYLALGSKNVKEATLNNLVKKVDVKQFAPQNGLADLNISSDNSDKGVKTYVNAFGAVIKNYLTNPIDRSEDAVIKDAIAKKGSGTKADLELLAITYKNFANDLVPLRVPSTFAKAHLLIVNGYRGMGSGLTGLSTIGTDPMGGTAGYEAYMKYRLDVVNGYALIVAGVSNQHISFAANESGYPFYWNITANEAWLKK